MLDKAWLGAVAPFAAAASPAKAQIFDYSLYPDLKGQWGRFVVPGLPGQPSFDQTKPWASVHVTLGAFTTHTLSSPGLTISP